MPGQVAAVDRGDVDRIERPEVGRVVPIAEVAAETLQASHRRQRRLQALDGLERADPTEFAGGGRRQQQKADIGRRRPVSDDGGGILLEIVRRQHVVGRGDERLEEPPGPSRDQPQRAGIGLRDRQAAGIDRRHAHPARDRGREQPGEDEGRRDRQRRTAGLPDGQGRQRRDQEASRHLAGEARPIVAPAVGLGRGGPVEQAAATDEQPVHGPADRIQHQPGLVGQKGHEQGGLRRRVDRYPTQAPKNGCAS